MSCWTKISMPPPPRREALSRSPAHLYQGMRGPATAARAPPDNCRPTLPPMPPFRPPRDLCYGQMSRSHARRGVVSMSRTMSRMKPEDAIGAKARPFTGAEFLASLRDGREIYIYGERVEDVTAHPAFRNAARSIARLYDALHDPKTKDILTWSTDTGSGGFTHKFFRAARSREELIAQ